MAGGDSGSNSNSSRSNSPKKKNESRLGKSPLNTVKEKKQSSSAGSSTETDSKKDSSSKVPKPRVYKAPPRPPTPHQSGNETNNNIVNGKETTTDDKKTALSNSSSGRSMTEESSSESGSNFQSMSGPKITVISFGKATTSSSSNGRSSRAPGSSPPPPATASAALLFKASSTAISQRADSPKPFQLTVETIMTSAKPLVFSVVKSQTIGAVKKAIKGKTKVRHFGIYLNNKELLPEDSTLESHGIVSDTKVRLHVKAQTGTTDKEDINSLIKLTKSINDLKTIINALPSSTSSKKAVRRRKERKHKAEADPQKKEEEDQRSRQSMARLREKFAQRRGAHEEKKKEEKKKKKKTRKEGGIAGQYPLPPTNHPKDPEDVGTAESASDQSNRSAEELSDRDKIQTSGVPGAIISIFEPSLDLGQCPVTNKELLLYFDVPETEDRAKFLATELFEPPNSLGKLEELRKEFKVSRCAHCRTKLPLILREMPCRCGKVFCQPHRSPFKHCCAVDLKKVDRIKLEKEVPKSNPVSRKNSDEEIQPKSFNKKFH